MLANLAKVAENLSDLLKSLSRYRMSQDAQGGWPNRLQSEVGAQC